MTNSPVKLNNINSFRFLKYKIKINEKIDIYINKVPISGWISSNIITIAMIIKLTYRYNLLLVLTCK